MAYLGPVPFFVVTTQVATFLLENFTSLQKSLVDENPKTSSEELLVVAVADEIKSKEDDSWDKEMDDKAKGWEKVCATNTTPDPGAAVICGVCL